MKPSNIPSRTSSKKSKDPRTLFREVYAHKTLIDESEDMFLKSIVSVDVIVDMRFKNRSDWVIEANRMTRKIKNDLIEIITLPKGYILKINRVEIAFFVMKYYSCDRVKLKANKWWKELYTCYLNKLKMNRTGNDKEWTRWVSKQSGLMS